MHLIGAIIGDVAGSRFEFHNELTKRFKLLHKDCCYTDDTVMTCAVAYALMRADGNPDFMKENTIACMRAVGQRFPYCGYGGRFFRWMFSHTSEPINSLGNGAAMRVSAVAEFAETEEELKQLTHDVTVVSHNHPEGLKAAEATAMSCWLAKNGWDKKTIREYITREYYPEMAEMSVEELHATYKKEIGDSKFREWAPYSVPQALVCFFESKSFEDAIRNCVYIGGDCDTTGAIAGGIAEYYYGVPKRLRKKVMSFLDDVLAMIVSEYYDNATS